MIFDQCRSFKAISFRLMVTAFIGIILSGCAERIKEREGKALHLVPLTYSLSLNSHKNGASTAKQEIEVFITQNFEVIEAKGMLAEWHNLQGKQLSNYARTFAKSLGIDVNRINVQRFEVREGEPITEFDLRLTFTDYQVITNLCEYPEVGKFGFYESNCYTDNARWQSMVNPENMLPKASNTQ